MTYRRVLVGVLLLLVLAAGCAVTGGGSKPVSAEAPSRTGYRSKVIVHYFHRKVRCQECLAVEEMSGAAVAMQYPALMASGRLEFRSVLLDAPDNWHYVDEFLLTSPSLVIAQTGESGLVRWKLLDKVWELAGSPPEIHSYVVEAIEEYLR